MLETILLLHYDLEFDLSLSKEIADERIEMS